MSGGTANFFFPGMLLNALLTPMCHMTAPRSFMISSSSGIMVNTSGSIGNTVMTTSCMTVSLPNGNGLMSRITWKRSRGRRGIGCRRCR